MWQGKLSPNPNPKRLIEQQQHRRNQQAIAAGRLRPLCTTKPIKLPKTHHHRPQNHWTALPNEKQ
jgi:hypothetical protein